MENPNICLILEGTYPYITGGVSGWAHQLILAQKNCYFDLVCLVSQDAKLDFAYELPPNVRSIKNIYLQTLPKGDLLSSRQRKKLFQGLEMPLLMMQHRPSLVNLQKILDALQIQNKNIGSEELLNSEESWQTLQRMYRETMGHASFLDFFWSWRGLLAGMFSVLLAEIPEADHYHALCTGYAGLYLAAASIKTGKPCTLTEHGIYTNERKIEITAADWLQDQASMTLNIRRKRHQRDLKDFWMDTFSGYSKLAYECADEIITLYEGNTFFQIVDGATPSKIRLIPNGVDVDSYSCLPKIPHDEPIIALVGRVVPIKDIKTYLRSALNLKEKLKAFQFLVIGPTDEDPDYFEECLEFVERCGLQDLVRFTGKAKMEEWYGKIDVMVLTSISEAQPLTLLEAGACGIPCVATDVGACREIIEGRSDESPPLGKGGVLVPLGSAKEVANAIYQLIDNHQFYAECSQAIQKRVTTYYNIKDQMAAYEEIYHGRHRVCT